MKRQLRFSGPWRRISRSSSCKGGGGLHGAQGIVGNHACSACLKTSLYLPHNPKLELPTPDGSHSPVFQIESSGKPTEAGGASGVSFLVRR